MQINCPITEAKGPAINLAHGNGGKASHDFLAEMIYSRFSNPKLDLHHDGAIVEHAKGKLAFTTDSYVVKPLFFPGGDIGRLAVIGTVNDLAMCGARATELSLALILAEGFSLSQLERILDSIQHAAKETNVQIITGDTKVVERTACDGIFINTAGLGVIADNIAISPLQVKPGDVILVSGDIGRHGFAILGARHDLGFDPLLESDLAPLNELVQLLLDQKVPVRCLRDLTRGGLASALWEIAASSQTSFVVDETKIPLAASTVGASELLGLDPKQVACEGRMIVIVPDHAKSDALKVLRSHQLGHNAEIIGNVIERSPYPLRLKTLIGTERPLEPLANEQLPRIC